MPDKATVFRWLVANEPFRDQYTLAREAQADTLFDEMLEIADDGSADYKLTNRDGGPDVVVDSEHIQRSRLRVDTRKWQASKLAPKKYGDKLDLNHGGEVGVAVTIKRFSAGPTS